jgi:hypothetical protein
METVMEERIWYMAMGSGNKSGPIKDTIKKATRGFFELYPNEKTCQLHMGDRCGDIFLAKLRSEAFEVTRESAYGE